ncbi:hypothetical protein CMZ84_04375 [Lysobacteraceae bacterium NML93-0399]|nr:hypothetical protein CMZ84_04375 [Xanthomonadaceae bacterium NML93-0399]
MTVLTDTIRDHFITCVDAGRFDGDGLDALLGHVEAAQFRLAEIEHFREASAANSAEERETRARIDQLAQAVILKGNADLEQPTHDAHVRAMEAREAVHRG